MAEEEDKNFDRKIRNLIPTTVAVMKEFGVIERDCEPAESEELFVAVKELIKRKKEERRRRMYDKAYSTNYPLRRHHSLNCTKCRRRAPAHRSHAQATTSGAVAQTSAQAAAQAAAHGSAQAVAHGSAQAAAHGSAQAAAHGSGQAAAHGSAQQEKRITSPKKEVKLEESSSDSDQEPADKKKK